MRKLAFTLLACLAAPPWAAAEPWSGTLAPSRAVDWSSAGVPGGIPNRTTVCATLSPGATAQQINDAIAACPANQVVYLNAGTYNLNGGFNGKSNVTLRGAGADQTKLIFTGGVTNCIHEASICIQGGGGNYGPNPDHTATWTGGYAKGSTSITLGDTTGLSAGDLLVLDQLADSNTDNGEVWVCYAAGVCSTEGITQYGRNNRTQIQVVTVTGVSGQTVSFKPALYDGNWRASQSPGAWWNNVAPMQGFGVENVSIDAGQNGRSQIVVMSNARGNWIKGARFIDLNSVNKKRSYVLFVGASQNTVRDSYFYGSPSGQSQNYGIENRIDSDNLIENTIWEAVTIPLTSGQSSNGTVWGYNYALNDTYTLSSTWMQASSYHHAVNNNHHLFEGNDGIGFTADAIHGPSFFTTAFRNRWRGFDPDGGSDGGKTMQTIPVHIYAFNRFFNIVGNVLGEPGLHSAYECFPSSATSTSCTTGRERSIFMLGWSGNQEKNAQPNDPLVRTTLMRWGNWDTVANAARFNTSDVPTGLSKYANPVPASQSLPAAVYHSSRPSWFGNVPWPPIGPDVSGGDVTGMGGKVHKIPARVCYESMADDPAYSGATVRVFNASRCFGTAAATVEPPTNLQIQ
jgi:hypothetical protein